MPKLLKISTSVLSIKHLQEYYQWISETFPMINESKYAWFVVDVNILSSLSRKYRRENTLTPLKLILLKSEIFDRKFSSESNIPQIHTIVKIKQEI